MRAHVGRLAALLAFALVTAVALPDAGAAKKRVVVLEFKGPKGPQISASIGKLLKKSATIISYQAFTKATKKVKGFKKNKTGYAKVGKKLKADAFINGKVSKKGKKYKLQLKVRDGKSGELLGEDIILTMKAPKLTKAHEKKLLREIKALLQEAGEAPAEEPEEEQEPVADEGGGESEGEGEEVRVAAAAGTEDEEGPPPKKGGKGGKKVAAAEEEGGGDEGSGDEGGGDEGGSDEGGGDEGGNDEGGDDEGGDDKKDDDGDDDGGGKTNGSVEKRVSLSSAEQADLDARGRAVDVSAGLTFQKRALSFTHNGTGTPPQGYDGALVPGLYILGDIYPMALVDKKSTGFARHIGITLVVDKVLLIKSKPQGMDVDLPTSQTRFGAGLVYRWNFGSSPTSPTLKIGARYNKLSFSIDESAADPGTVNIPDVSYTYIDPGVGFRYPITEQIAASAEGRFLFVSAAGQIQNVDQYGTSTITGLDFDAGAEYKLTSSLLVRGGVRIMRLSLSFSGDGAMSDPDMDGTKDVPSATDQYLGVYMTAGYLF